tara:strand:- start:1004 stop:2230 length:1227 start_codon:yes stop_codon:yes gene_type:complete
MSKVSNTKETDTDTNKKNLYSNVNNLYKKAGYLNIYGIDLIITVVISIFFVLIIIYFSIVNNLGPIKANWDSNKCKPSVIPFAGIINKPDDDSVFEFSQKNFINCSQTMLRDVVDNAFKPIYLAYQGVNNTFKVLAVSLKKIYQQITNIQLTGSGILDVLNRYLGGLMVPIREIIISFKDLLNKIQASVVVILYSLFGPYYILLGILEFFINYLLEIIGIAIGIVVLFVILVAIWPFGLGFVIPLKISVAIASGLIGLLAVLTILIHHIRETSMCFDPDTKIQLDTGELIAIKDVKLGSILKNGSIVQSVMRINNLDENNNIINKMYKLEKGEKNEPIYVTGSHLIYDSNIKDFVEVGNYRGTNPAIESNKECPELACLITSDHTIPIGDEIFHDWEDNNGSDSKNIN